MLDLYFAAGSPDETRSVNKKYVNNNGFVKILIKISE